MKENLVILFSGGADSVLLMEMAKSMGKIPMAVIINYEQLIREELNVAQKYCMNKKIKYELIKLEGYNVKSGLTSGDKGIYEGVSEMNVPFRNSIFITLAAGIAESNSINEIWFGADFSDREHLFPDCYQEFVFRMNNLLEIAGVKPIKLYAPLLGFTKEHVLSMLKYYNVNVKDIYSGYGEFA